MSGRMALRRHEWSYAGAGEPFRLFAVDVHDGMAQADENWYPSIETDLSPDEEDSFAQEGILLDACAEEILRLTGVIAALEAEIERLKAEKREEFAVLRGAIDKLSSDRPTEIPAPPKEESDGDGLDALMAEGQGPS